MIFVHSNYVILIKEKKITQNHLLIILMLLIKAYIINFI